VNATPNRRPWPGGWDLEREGRSCPDTIRISSRSGRFLRAHAAE
jgi:hypothetical protein